MLVDRNNNPTIGDIVTVKLISGEEIVGKITERTIDSVFLGKPVQIGMQQVNQNEVGLVFSPVLGSALNVTIQIPLAAMCIRPVKTGDDVTRNYLQTTTGIVPATAKETSIISA